MEVDEKLEERLLVYVAGLSAREGKIDTDMSRLTTGVRSEKCVDRRVRRCENVYLHKLQGGAYVPYKSLTTLCITIPPSHLKCSTGTQYGRLQNGGRQGNPT
jgi:hypothetical protein